MAITPLQSRIEELLANGSNAVKPQSRIEILLVELLQFIETGMASVFHYKGSVATYADLLLITGAEVGDVYNVESDSMNYAWDGTAWDTLGAILAIDSTITQNSQNPVTSAAIYSALSGKVDSIVGKGLSTEDYTTAEKEKLSGIGTGAEANVQPDWNQSDNTADDFVKNKPTLGTAAASNVASAIGDTSDLPTAAQVNTALAGKQDSLSPAQMNAANSGITAAKVTQYDKDGAALVEVVNGGAKNFFNVTKETTTQDGVTFTNNGDGTVTSSGTLDEGKTDTYLGLGAVNLPAGDYVFTCADGASFGGYDSYVYISGSSPIETVARDIDGYHNFTLTEPTRVVVRIRVRPGYEAATFRPMICTKAMSDISGAFEPYCPDLQAINTWVEYECFYATGAGSYFNSTTSSVKVRVNRALKRCVADISLTAIAEITTSTNAFNFANLSGIPDNTEIRPGAVARTMAVSKADNYTAVVSKAPSNATLSFFVSAGTIASGTSFTCQLSWDFV